MYAVVKAGGSQHKVAVGDTFTINRLQGAAGDTVALPAILLVDGDTVTSDDKALAKVTEVEKTARRLTLMELTEKTCKWPVGDPATPNSST